jgi:hypothetical protein
MSTWDAGAGVQCVARRVELEVFNTHKNLKGEKVEVKI